MRTALKSIRGWILDRFIEYPSLDYLVSVVVVFAQIAACEMTHRWSALEEMGLERRDGLVTDVMVYVGVAFGFAGAALATYALFDSERIRNIRAAVGEQVNRSWLSVLVGYLTAFVVLVVAKVYDGQSDTNPPHATSVAHWFEYGAGVLFLSCTLRLIYIYFSLIAASIAKPKAPAERITFHASRRQKAS